MQGNDRIGLMIVDDHPVVRHAVCSFLGAQSNMEIIGEAGSVAEAMDKLRYCKPDVLIMDLMLPDGSGVDATRALTNEKQHRVIAFSAYESPDCIQAFVNAGGRGFVAKSSNLDILVSAITAVANDESWLPATTAQEKTAHSPRQNHGLSAREQEIVALVAQGLTSALIADRLCISLKTVETHRHNIFKKLGIKKSAQLVKYAIDNSI